MIVPKVQPIKTALAKSTIGHSVPKQAKHFEGIAITPEKLAAMRNGIVLHSQKIYATGTENCDSSYHGPNCASPDFCW